MKVRLGFVNTAGQQKGVDSLVVTDMITLARNRAMAECVLLSGDEDIRVGVQQAQEYGVRVHILSIRGNVVLGGRDPLARAFAVWTPWRRKSSKMNPKDSIA